MYSFLSCRRVLLRRPAIFARPVMYRQGSRCSVLSVVCSLRAGRPENRVRFLVGAYIFYLRCGMCSGWGFHLDSYPLRALDFHLWARNLPLSFSLERPTCLCNRCRRERRGGGVAGTNHRGPAFRKGARNPDILNMSVSSSVVSLFINCTNLPVKRRSPSPPSNSVTVFPI
jgi:hypothetical protein